VLIFNFAKPENKKDSLFQEVVAYHNKNNNNNFVFD